MRNSKGKMKNTLLGLLIAGSTLIPANMVLAGNYLYGDVTGDGIVDSADYTYLRKYLLGNTSTLPSVDWEITADVNQDGSIDSGDYTIMRSYLLGKISSLPIGTPKLNATQMRKHILDRAAMYDGKINYYSVPSIVPYNFEDYANANNGGIPLRMDCSDFTASVYKTESEHLGYLHNQLQIGGWTGEQKDSGVEVLFGTGVKPYLKDADLKQGDLILFDWGKSPYESSPIDSDGTHVGLYWGLDSDGNHCFIHMTGTNDKGGTVRWCVLEDEYSGRYTYWDYVYSVRRIIQDDGSIR